MKNVAFAVVLLCLFIRAVTLDAETPPKAPDIRSESTEDLISQFQQVSEQTVGLDSLATAQGFVALDAPLTFGGGILGTPRPPVLPTMQELVRRGFSAMPALLDHLTDARPTELILKQTHNRFDAQWFGNEYDPKNPNTNDFPAGLSRAGRGLASGDRKTFTEYRVKVGDLCFVTLGQIVNRQLEAIRYQPTACVVVNSPVEIPALAAATRADWNGLTAAKFKDFLVRDTTEIDPYISQTGALQRLLFYYPDDGRALAVRWLDRSLYNVKPVEMLLESKSLKSANAAAQDQLLGTFRAKNGEVFYQAAVQALLLTAHEIECEEIQPGEYAYAVGLVHRRFGDADKHSSPIEKIVDCADQQSFVEALAVFPSTEIDQAVRDLLKRTLELQPSDHTDQYNQCQLAVACARRLATPTQSKAIAGAAERLRSELPPEQASVKAIKAYDHDYLNFLQDVARIVTPATSPMPAQQASP